jgi:hypothetical protein
LVGDRIQAGFHNLTIDGHDLADRALDVDGDFGVPHIMCSQCRLDTTCQFVGGLPRASIVPARGIETAAGIDLNFAARSNIEDIDLDRVERTDQDGRSAVRSARPGRSSCSSRTTVNLDVD